MTDTLPTKTFKLNKKDYGDGISHPAPYPNALLALFQEVVPVEQFSTILDPFAGTGRIHELENKTLGTEIEPEWAAIHPDTICASATELPFPDGFFDAIVTSPTYGNRLADRGFTATPETRHSYTFDIGRELSKNNSGGMYWGTKYRELHLQAWAEAVRVLRPEGRFVLNIKDHIKLGKRQFVSAWHCQELLKLGLRLLWVQDVFTRGLPHNNKIQALPEQIFVMEKK